MPDRMTIVTNDDLYSILSGMGLGPRRINGQIVSRCPVHEDRKPSFSAKVAPDGRLLLYCHAGCPFVVLLDALGLRGSSSFRSIGEREQRKPERRPDPAVPLAWNEIMARDPAGVVEDHERTLGIPGGGLRRIGCAWAIAFAALAAPMFSGPPELIGVRLRADDGSKWALPGSRNGLFMPEKFTGSGSLWLPEGMTDTAALCGLGLDAVGRPSCNGGRDLVRAFVPRGRPLVVVSDSDAPGRAGADLLAGELSHDGHDVKVLVPPNGIKDVREWIARGATRGTIEYAAWCRKRWTAA